MAKYIVLCDSDAQWSQQIQKYLYQRNVNVVEVYSVEEAVSMIAQDKDAVMLICSWLEYSDFAEETKVDMESDKTYNVNDILNIKVPVFIVSDSALLDDELSALKVGVADYQYRNRSLEIIGCRIFNIYSKYNRRQELYYDPMSHDIYYLNQRVELTAKEVAVLGILISGAGQIVPRSKLISDVWGENYQQNSRALDTVIKQIRKKIYKYGQTIRGYYARGYSLQQL